MQKIKIIKRGEASPKVTPVKTEKISFLAITARIRRELIQSKELRRKDDLRTFYGAGMTA